MTRDEMIALLRERGVSVANDATDQWLKDQLKKLSAPQNAAPPSPPAAPATPPVTAPAVNVVEMQTQIMNINNQLAAERRTRIETIVNGLVTECRVTASEAPRAITRAIADETYLDELRLRPQILPGHEPLNAGLVIVAEDVRNIFAGMRPHVCKRGTDMVANAPDRNAAVGAIYRKERERIIQVMNAAVNTIDADLKRVLILQETVRAFATRMLPLTAFATVFSNVPLQGTDELVVAFYPLQTEASQDFNVTNGYLFDKPTSTGKRKITVDKRKYQALDYSSQEFRRQPWFDAVRLGLINAEKLGIDVLTDILSVITIAKFPTVAKNLNVGAWTSDDVIDLGTSGTDANWPTGGRSLIVNTAIDNALQKDPAYKLALNINGTEVIRGGRIPRVIGGFNYFDVPNFPANGEGLKGFIGFQSAIGVATAPVDPVEGVRAQLVAYEVATDAETGISMNYRKWGDAQLDRDFEIIESAYGKDVIVETALQRITAP